MHIKDTVKNILVDVRTRTSIRVMGQFEAVHCWPAAPDTEFYLREPHRHMFEVTVTLEASHDDRELEFYAVKKKLSRILDLLCKPLHFSCEQYAKAIYEELCKEYGVRRGAVHVSEDGKEGASVAFTPNGEVSNASV